MLRSKSGMHIQISTGGHLGARWKRCIFIIGAGCTKYIYIYSSVGIWGFSLVKEECLYARYNS